MGKLVSAFIAAFVVVTIVFSTVTGLSELGGEGFVKGAFGGFKNVFVYHMLFRSHPGWAEGSLGSKNYMVFWGLMALVLVSVLIGGREQGPPADIVCAKCDQYLGTSRGFEVPCPRCGSNRWKRE